MYRYKIYRDSAHKFTESEIDAITKVSEIVSYLFDVTVEEIAGTSRKKPLPDARRIICHYAYYNIFLDNFIGERNVALASWFLDLHHTSVCYYVTSSENMYSTDKFYKDKYDRVIAIINGEDVPDHIEAEFVNRAVKRELTWDFVKSSPGFPRTVKESLMPLGVASTIKNMREAGYSPVTISKDVKASANFIDWYAKKNDLKPKSNVRLFNNGPATFVKMPKPTYTIDY